MHIIEGYLPIEWCAIWLIISLAVVIYGIKEYKEHFSNNKEALLLLILSGVFAFFVSMVAFPSVKGSFSHPAATGLLTVFFGPSITALVSFVFVFLQAIILAYGGLTTVGASVFGVGVLGPLCGYIVWKELRKRDINVIISVFLVTIVINIFSCIASSLELALVYPYPTVQSSFFMFLSIYTIPEILILIIDCFSTIIVFALCLSLFDKLIGKNDLLNNFRW